MKSLKFITSVVIFAVLAAFLGAVSAAGPDLPQVSMQSRGEKVVDAHTMYYDWVYWSGDSWHATGNWREPGVTKEHWPKGKVDAGAKVWVKSMRPDKPAYLSLESYTEVDKQTAQPKGEATVLHRYQLHPMVTADNHVKGWKTYFYTKDAPTDYYITVNIGYKRQAGTHHSYGGLEDNVHLKTTR